MVWLGFTVMVVVRVSQCEGGEEMLEDGGIATTWVDPVYSLA